MKLQEKILMGKKQCKELVVKSNNLIEASYKLTLQEQRLILFMVSMIKKDDKDFQPYKIRINEFNKIVGIQNQAGYTETKELTKQILSRVLSIKEPDGVLYINWLSSAKYYEKEGCVEFCFDPKLKPYLLMLQSYFTKYQLENTVRLKSFHTIRIYELLKQYESRGERTFDLNHLRDILGIEPGQYSLYGDFKKRILKPSQKEISRKTDITFDFEERKEGRRVTGLVFKIQSKNKPEHGKDEVLKVLKDSDIESVLNLLPEEHRNKKTVIRPVTEYFRKHGFEYVRRNIEYATDQKPRTYRIYLEKALKNDWGLGFDEDRKQEAEEKARQKAKQAEKAAKEKQKAILEKCREEFEQVKEERFWKKFDRLSKKEQEKIKAGFLKKIDKNRFLKKFYNEGGIKSRGVRGIFQGYAENAVLNETERDFDTYRVKNCHDIDI